MVLQHPIAWEIRFGIVTVEKLFLLKRLDFQQFFLLKCFWLKTLHVCLWGTSFCPGHRVPQNKAVKKAAKRTFERRFHQPPWPLAL